MFNRASSELEDLDECSALRGVKDNNFAFP
jgi:hypothetical protein